ncbi:hypothetical protein BX666DRAFT_2033206 [Dichotomocladium elegans]|nr:hypothetical protein BX666DRAFT_2033206 [Dichotomocladium elegans]
MPVINTVAFAETFHNEWDEPIGVRTILEDYVAFPLLLHALTKQDEGAAWQRVDRKLTFAQVVERAGTNHAIPRPVMPVIHRMHRLSYSRSEPTKDRDQAQYHYVDEQRLSCVQQGVIRQKHTHRIKQRCIAKRKQATADILLQRNLRLIGKAHTACMERYNAYAIRDLKLREQCSIDREALESKWGFLHSLRLHYSRVEDLIVETYCKDMVNHRLEDLHTDDGACRKCKTRKGMAKLRHELIDAYNNRRRNTSRRCDCDLENYNQASSAYEILADFQVFFRQMLQKDLLLAEKHSKQLFHAKNKIKEHESRQIRMLLPKQCFPQGKKVSRLEFVRQVIRHFNQEVAAPL